MRRRGLFTLITILLVIGSTSVSAIAQEGESTASCDRYAAPGGSDNASGTIAAPYATPAKLVSSLPAGGVGCLRAGTYSFTTVAIKTAQITLRAHADEVVTLKGSLRVNPTGTGTVIEGLRLNGNGPDSKHGPNLYADDVVLRDNEITNENTGICVQIARYYDNPGPRNVVVEKNRIHHCGELPRTNHHHGIYNSAGVNAVIRGNWIYSNADRGIQLYPDAQDTLIKGNVIEGNHHGLNFSCNSSKCSRGNVAERNVISGSASWSVYGHSQGGTPDGSNVLRDNCVWKSGGTDGIDSDTRFFSESGNRVAKPVYASASSSNYELAPGTLCADIVGSSGTPPEAPTDPGAEPADPPKPGRGKGPRKVRLKAGATSVAAGERVTLRGRLKGNRATRGGRNRVVIEALQDGSWRRATSRRVSGRRFKARPRAAGHRGELYFRARVKSLGSSRAVRVTIVD